MAAGIEARVPLLDENLLKISLGLPTNWKVNRTQSKIILRNSQRGRLPSSILDGPKTGLGVPYEFWLRSSLFNFTQDRLLNAEFTDYFGFKKSAVETKLSRTPNWKFEHGFVLWKLLQLALWLENRIKNIKY